MEPKSADTRESLRVVAGGSLRNSRQMVHKSGPS